jgi:hypothetical protein
MKNGKSKMENEKCPDSIGHYLHSLHLNSEIKAVVRSRLVITHNLKSSWTY